MAVIKDLGQNAACESRTVGKLRRLTSKLIICGRMLTQTLLEYMCVEKPVRSFFQKREKSSVGGRSS